VPDIARRAISIPIALALAFAAGACSDDESVFNAEVGECVENLSDLSGSVSELPEAACDEDHEGEIFLLIEHEGDDDDFPGAGDLEAEAREECEGDEFEDFVGVPYEDTAIVVAYIAPSDDSWGSGDRETICVLTLAGQRVDESFEGNGEDFPLREGGSSGTTSGEELTTLIDDCEGGDNAACDELYRQTPVGSEEERIGSTCGGRSDEELFGACEATLG
jgi:hypothetical protein